MDETMRKLLVAIGLIIPEEMECVQCGDQVLPSDRFCMACGNRNLRFSATEEVQQWDSEQRGECTMDHAGFYADKARSEAYQRTYGHEPLAPAQKLFCYRCGSLLEGV